MHTPVLGQHFLARAFFVAVDDNSEQILADQIVENAQAPQSTTSDGLTTSYPSLPDQIAAAKFIAARQAAAAPPFGVTFAKLVAPGAQS